MIWEYDKKEYKEKNPIQYVVRWLRYGYVTDELLDLDLAKKYYSEIIKHLNKEEKWFIDFLLDKND